MTDLVCVENMVDLITDKASTEKDVNQPYIGLEHIESGTGKIIGYIRAGDSKSTNGTFLCNDILFGKLRPRLRKCCMAPFDGYCSTDILILRAKENIAPSFAYRAISSENVFSYAIRFEEGTKMPRTSWRNLAGASVWCPQIKEQQTIATILDSVDESIRWTEAVIAKLKLVKEGMLHDLLSRGIDENGDLRDPVAYPEQFKDSPLGRVPREWETKTLGTLCSHIGSGVTPRGGQDVYTKKGILFIRSQNVTFEGLKLGDIAYIPLCIYLGMLRSEVFAHDVLFNITGASIGRCCAMPDGMGQANVNQHVCILRVPEATEADAIFLSTVLGSTIGQKQLDALNTCGNRQGLNYQQLGSFIVPWPEVGERHLIAEYVKKATIHLNRENDEVNKLRLLKSGLQDDLLTGRVRVPKKFLEVMP